jgi:hypothetical protein
MANLLRIKKYSNFNVLDENIAFKAKPRLSLASRRVNYSLTKLMTGNKSGAPSLTIKLLPSWRAFARQHFVHLHGGVLRHAPDD